jgi:hypothetical protein
MHSGLPRRLVVGVAHAVDESTRHIIQILFENIKDGRTSKKPFNVQHWLFVVVKTNTILQMNSET